MAKILPARLKEMGRIAAKDPKTRFPIILTLKNGASPKLLEASGFVVEHHSFNIVSGVASLESVKKLSVIDEVELIEDDGEVRVIGDSRP